MKKQKNLITRLIIVLIYFSISFNLHGQEPENFDASNSANCSTEQINIFRAILDLYQGVEGYNKDAYYIGNHAAHKEPLIFGKNWYPLEDNKQALCGELNKFSTYDGLGDEMDWNLFVKPDTYFYNKLVEPARSYGFKFDPIRGLFVNDDWHKTASGIIQVEGEITPDENLYTFPWFPKGGRSILESRKICLYGPYVREEVHGNRPEIHPCEQIWWRDAQDAYYLTIGRRF